MSAIQLGIFYTSGIAAGLSVASVVWVDHWRPFFVLLTLVNVAMGCLMAWGAA